MSLNTLTILLHGESGVGKTRFGDTTPEPRLVIDAEGGIKFTPSTKVMWEDVNEPPPDHDGSWETCVVQITEFEDLLKVYRWLESGKHPFKSISMDSVSDIQERCMEAIAGTDPMRIQDWGELLRKMTKMIRAYRDLTMKGKIDVIVFVALTEQKDDKFRPLLSGKLQRKLPGYVDVVGYMHSKVETTDDGEGEIVRKLLTQDHPGFVAKDRTDRLPTVLDDPSVPKMMDIIFG